MPPELGRRQPFADLPGLRAHVTVWVANQVVRRFTDEGRALFPLETGGVLLGWRDSGDSIVAAVLGPGPRALHGRHLFVPDHEWQVTQVRAAFKATGGDLNYVGDWHTHPSGIAEMSGQDRRTLDRLSRRVKGALMIIAAGEDDDWRIGGWSQTHRRLFGAARSITQAVRTFDAPASWPRID